MTRLRIVAHAVLWTIRLKRRSWLTAYRQMSRSVRRGPATLEHQLREICRLDLLARRPAGIVTGDTSSDDEAEDSDL